MAISLEDFAKRIKLYASSRRLSPVIEPQLGAAGGRARDAVRKAIERTELGRALWKRKKGDTPTMAITGAKVRKAGGGYEARFTVAGMPALIDRGGKTAEHTIQASGAGRLAFAGTGAYAGRVVQAEQVRHPGSIVRRENVVRPAIVRSMGTFEKRLARAMDRHGQRIFR